VGRELHRITGVDLTRIDGIDVGVAQTLISEVGLDMTRWPDEHHFASWLGLCPDNRITGGNVIRRGTRPVINRAATALRIGTTRSKLGAPKAITAMAHKLAVLVYRMLRWGHEYVDKGMAYYEERHREQQIRLLKKRAATLGLAVV
jgi:transposase